MEENVGKFQKFAFLAIVFDGLCVSSASIILPLLQNKYGLNYNMSGILLAMLSVGNLISAWGCGVLPRFIGVRKTAIIFTSGMMIGYLMMGFSGTVIVLCTGFLAVGLAKGAAMNNATVIIGRISKDKVNGMNLLHAMFALGSLIAPFIFIFLTREGKFWNLPLIGLSISGFILWIIFIICVRPNNEEVSNEKKNQYVFLKTKRFWIASGLLVAQQCSEISVFGWIVSYFKDAEILVAPYSEFTVTVVWIAMLIARLLLAFVISSRSKLKSLRLMSIGCLFSYILLLSTKDTFSSLVGLFLYGFCIAGTFPGTVAQASKEVDHAMLGVLLPLGSIGAIIMPYLIGLVAEIGGIVLGMATVFVPLILMIIFSFLLHKEKSL